MAKEVKVPVKVTGSKQAQSDLKKTGKAVEGVGSAGARAAAGTQQATAATKAHTAAQGKAAPAVKKTTQAVNQFDDSAKTAITGILGQFSPALASIGNIAVDVAKGFTKMSRALIGMLGVGVAIGVGVALFQKIRGEIRKTMEEAASLETRIDKLRHAFKEPQEKMAATLQRFGALTKETEQAAGGYRRRLERKGFLPETAVGIAPLAALDQLTTGEAEVAAQLAAQGISFEKPGDIRKALDGLRRRQPNVLDDAKRQIEAMQETQTVRARRARAVAQPVGDFTHRAMELAREELIGAGALPEDMSQREFRGRVEEARHVRGVLEYMRKTGKKWIDRTRAHPDAGLKFAWIQRYFPTRRSVIADRLKRMPATAWVPTVEKWEHRGDDPLAEPSLPGAPIEVPESVRAAAARGAQVPATVNNITNNQYTINQGLVLDASGVMARPQQITPEIIENGVGM